MLGLVRIPFISQFLLISNSTVSIRAYGAQQMFKKESLKRLDHFILVSRTSYNVNRWIGVRLNVLGASLTSSLAAYLVYGSTGNPANIGFSLTMAADICLTVLWWVQVFNEFEVQSNRYIFHRAVYFILTTNSVWSASRGIWRLSKSQNRRNRISLQLHGRRVGN